MVDGNFRALIKEGNPPASALITTWANIQQEYVDAIGDNEHRLYVKLYSQVAILGANIECIALIIKALRRGYYEGLVIELNKMLKTNFKFDWNNQVEYQKNLNRCENRAKSLKIELTLKVASLEKLQEKQTKKSYKPTHEYFQSILITLSDHAKFQIQDNISVFAFCERMKRYNKSTDNLQKNKPNGRGIN
jgi:alpha-amylase/alpha-mannosidase (GH57 family)